MRKSCISLGPVTRLLSFAVLTIVACVSTGWADKPLPQLAEKDARTFLDRRYTAVDPHRTLRAFRLLTRDDVIIGSDGQIQVLKSGITEWYILGPVRSVAEAANLAGAPPNRKYEFLMEVEIGPDSQGVVGIAAGGEWFQLPSKAGKPDYEFVSDNLMAIRRDAILKAGGVSLGHVSGGGVQIHVPVRTNDDRIRVVSVRRLDDDGWITPVGRPDGGGPPKGPQPNAARMTLTHSANQNGIRGAVGQYGVFPGGVLIESKPQMQDRVSRLRFDRAQRALILDESCRFFTELTDDEIVEIAQVVLGSTDHRLAALSQTESLGVSADSSIGSHLTRVDALLGQILYGYGIDGESLPQNSQPPGYRNPMLRRTSAYESGDLAVVCRGIRADVYDDMEPRVFLAYRDVEFAKDATGKTLTVKSESVRVFSQVFRYSRFGEIEFSTKSPETVEPEIMSAIGHFQDNYAAYEQRLPLLKRSRDIAQIYALLTHARDCGAKIDLTSLDDAKQHPLRLSAAQRLYSHVSEASSLARSDKRRHEALRAIELKRWKDMTSEDQLWLTVGLLKSSLDNNAWDLIPIYREQAIRLAAKVLPSGYADPGTPPRASDVIHTIRQMKSARIAGKIAFANRVGSGSPEGREAVKAAIDWYERLIVAEPRLYTSHAVLADLYETMNSSTSVAKFQSQAFERALPLAEAGDRDAQLFVGERYLAMKSGELATKFYVRAALNGQRHAQFVIATSYENQRDPIEAVRWLTKAAEAGHPNAMLELGQRYLKGHGVSQDPAKAKIWLTRAERL